MKRALNTIPLSKRKHYMSNFFVPRTNNRKPIVSKTPFVGYERAYRSDTEANGAAAGGRQAPTTQCLNPLIVKEGSGEPLVPWAHDINNESSANANSMSLPASVNNPFAMFKNPATASASASASASTTTPLQTAETYKLEFDGCSKGNPGRAGAGAVLYEGSREIWADAKYVGDKETNNVAEYTGLIMGLHEARRRNISRLLVRGDSELIIKQMNGQYAVKSENIRHYHQAAKDLAAQFKWIEFRHVYRKDNARADELSNKGLLATIPVVTH
jgi:ribonuclease HI